MPIVRVLSAADVASLLVAADLRHALEAALVAQSEGLADVPPRIAAVAPTGMLAAMPGFLDDGGDGLLATKLVSIFPDNADAPSHQGLIAYFDAATGTPLALMDAELITEERTAGTAAIAADLLARPTADTLTIVGSGAQGRAHLRAFGPIRQWSTIRLLSRTRTHADALAEYATTLGLAATVEVVSIDDVDDAVRVSAVVALCTHADHAVFTAEVTAPGTHVSSVGSRAELPTGLVGRGGVIVVDHVGAATTAPPAGAAELQGLDAGDVTELGALIAGSAAGRSDDAEITIYKSTGHAVQDLAAAHLVFRRAVAASVGTSVEL
jgi:ornithine cyclodeaminase/alanine dehydrogenase-like protein (mu-crystallin family)